MLDALDGQARRTAEQLARLGDLSYVLDEHQYEQIYMPYRSFEERMHEHEGDGFYNCWMLDAGRQVGKTFTVSLIRVEDAIRWPGSRYLLACATEVSLSEFIIPNIDTIIEFLPDDMRPKFLRNHRGMKAGYWFPNGSVLKLVGIDKNPKGLRGPRLDGASIHEAAFPDKLAKVVVGVIQPQFQRGRDPTLILESSAPENPEHDFDLVFKPSCERRDAYVFMTIDDNTALSSRRKEAILSAAREIDPDDAEREYYGKRTRDKKLTVFPAVDNCKVLESYDLPKYGLSLLSLDPGQVHMFALSWSVYDVTRGQVVFLDDWAESNPNTERVAAIVAAREFDLFGTPPNPRLARIPLDDEYAANGEMCTRGWRTLLAGDRCEHHADRLHSLAQRVGGGELSAFQWYDNDARIWRGNPMTRVSDTQLQLINDLSNIYGLHVSPTTKDDLKDVMVKLANAKMLQGRVTFGPLAKKTHRHCQAALWNKQRTKFSEHPQYGHFDLAACVVYALRFWESLYNIVPDPPEFLLKPKTDAWVGDVEGTWDNSDDEGMW